MKICGLSLVMSLWKRCLVLKLVLIEIAGYDSKGTGNREQGTGNKNYHHDYTDPYSHGVITDDGIKKIQLLKNAITKISFA